MKITGIICEYNPLHSGHEKQLRFASSQGMTVCLMSGDYVQRGEPAMIDKHCRAAAAVRSGADLVLELPVTYSLRSAEGFADGGVEILHRLGGIDRLCFGSECGDVAALTETAKLLLSPDFSRILREKLQQGLSFPAARQSAAEALGASGSVLENPNDILAVEYCKALLRRSSTMEPLVLKREGCYHSSISAEAPSATVLRSMEQWEGYMSSQALALQSSASRHTLQWGERAVLAVLRRMEEEEFSKLPFGSEGLWRKLMAACHRENTLEEILFGAKSKRYTLSRLRRMVLCAFLGIDEALLSAQAPYIRVLAMNERGAKLIRQFRAQGSCSLLHSGERAPDSAYARLERRAEGLYGLFAQERTEGALRSKKVQYEREVR